MEMAEERESRRRRRAPTLILFPPGQKEQILADSPCSRRHWRQFHGRDAGQQSTGMHSHLREAEDKDASLHEWPSRALPVMTEWRSLLLQE
jgi:hypothetical protein